MTAGATLVAITHSPSSFSLHYIIILHNAPCYMVLCTLIVLAPFHLFTTQQQEYNPHFGEGISFVRNKTTANDFDGRATLVALLGTKKVEPLPTDNDGLGNGDCLRRRNNFATARGCP